MGDVKWIKITTNIFDDEKIKLIDAMPARDEILVIWFKMLILAGKANEGGALMMGGKIAYSPEMMAAIFNREIATIRLALATFQNFGMIEVEADETVVVTNWEKHQNSNGLEKIKEQNRLRQARHREKRKQLAESNVNSNVTSRDCNIIVTEQNKNKKENKNKKDNSEAEAITAIIDFLNNELGKNYKASASGNKSVIKARLKEGFTVDDFKTVILKKKKAWQGTEMDSYLRPQTLFGNKFDGYLNEHVAGVTSSNGTGKMPETVQEISSPEMIRWIEEINFSTTRFAKRWGKKMIEVSFEVQKELERRKFEKMDMAL